MTETLTERQLEREAGQVVSGRARYYKNLDKGDVGDSKPGKELTRRAVQPVASAVQAMIDRVESGKAGSGKPAIAVQYLRHLQPEAVAYLTARAVISAAMRSDKVTRTALTLARMIEESYRFDELRIAELALANSAERKAKRWTTSHHRRAIMRHAADVASVKGLSWAKGDQLRVGMKLIELFIETVGLVERVKVSEGKNKTNYIIVGKPEMLEWLNNMHDHCAVLEPRFLPMVIEPQPWVTPIKGGYLTEENKQDFVRGTGREFKDDMMSLDLRDVFTAVNHIQNTAWRINSQLRDVMMEAWKSGSTLGGLPESDPLPRVPRPVDIPRDLRKADMNEKQLATIEEYRIRARKVNEYNAELIGRRLALGAKLSMATTLIDDERFYFPHNVDFRGRVYSLVPELNPQTDDIGKALLEFADGKPLGKSGAYWLHVHIANLFGIDKVSFDERVAWVQDHSEELLDSAINPLDGNRTWCTADDPWQALAACFEYAGYNIEGDEFVSRLPIAMDGSCSGLQHYSAMLLDDDGAAAVNLKRADTPSDIYTQVAERTEELLKDSDEQIAAAWAGKVERKIVKRPCMTFAYSVTSRGMRDQILDELRKQTGNEDYLPGYDNWEASTFLSPIVEQAIKDTVDRAAEAMDWLKDSVKLLLDNEVPVTWVTPLGFPVQQRYFRSIGQRFNVWFQGLRLKVQIRKDSEEADKRKQASAIAPNFVHSMDACHLMMVANRMVLEEVTADFAMIHDSFGVHACDVDELHFVIRDEFIKMYSVNQLVRFSHFVASRLPKDERDKMLPVPEQGDYDLEEVRDADFFFA
jgi:DNA-directed RNA polymerase